MIRTVIVDDEAPARARLRQLLKGEADFEIVGEFANGRLAIAGIQREKPDLAFLDVQMPQLNGFDVCEALQKPPLVVFVTAYDQYALQAFDVHAIDYLLKPFDRDRFQKALGRVRAQIGGGMDQRLAALLADLRPGFKKPDRLVFKENGRIIFVPVSAIDYLEADGNYVRLHAGNDSHYFRETLANLEAQLPAEKFARVNRSTMVNFDRVKELQPMFSDYTVLLHNGVKLTLTRNYRDRVTALAASR
jgi:two-component system LytT family response regulator